MAALVKDDNNKDGKSERFNALQKKLTRMVQEDPIDWDRIRDFMVYEDLSPNHVDSSSLVETTHIAAYAGESDILRWCLDKNANVDARTSVGRSVLHYACDGNRTRCIRLLLEQHADANTRTLSHMTPLHLCCQYNNYDSVLVLLHESNQPIDIDGEDSKRRIPEMLTENKTIRRAIKTYRSSFDEKRKQALIDQSLRRVFKLFDKDGDNFIYPEEWAETQALIAEFFENHCDDGVDEFFLVADKNKDGQIDFEEFKNSQNEMLEALGVPHRELMHRLCDIEYLIFQERVRIETGEEQEVLRPVVSPHAKELSKKRSQTKETPDENNSS